VAVLIFVSLLLPQWDGQAELTRVSGYTPRSLTHLLTVTLLARLRLCGHALRKKWKTKSKIQKVVKPQVSKTRSPAVARVGPTVLVVTDLEGHQRSIFMSSERAYATSY